MTIAGVFCRLMGIAGLVVGTYLVILLAARVLRLPSLVAGLSLLSQPRQATAPDRDLLRSAGGDRAAAAVQRDVRRRALARRRRRDPLPARSLPGAGARRFDRRDAGDLQAQDRRPARALRRPGHRVRPPRRPLRLQGRRARERPAHRQGRVHPDLRRRLPAAGRRARAQHPPLPRPARRGRAVPLGPPQPRLLGADRGAGADARRPLHDGARRPQPLRPLLQLQRHRRHLAARPRSPTRAAGSTTR